MKKHKYKKGFGNSFNRTKKKKIRKELIWSLFIALILVSSIIGFMWVGNEDSDFTYKDEYEFTRRNDVFVYEQGKQEFLFRYLPDEVEKYIEDIDVSIIKKPMIYLTFDPNSELIEGIDWIRFELGKELPKLNVVLSEGVVNQSGIYTLPIIDCANATTEVPVIKIIESNVTSLIQEDNCLLLNTKSIYDIAKHRDVILYSILGIL